jgi:hypothetical protein
MADMCDRCGDKSQMTNKYQAMSTMAVSTAYASRNGIKNSQNGAKDKNIHTCNICTSPQSRRPLHEKTYSIYMNHSF